MAALCAERDREKAEAVLRTRVAMAEAYADVGMTPGDS